MMSATIAGVLCFLALPFWQAREPSQWSDLELQQLLSDSPWAQTLGPVPVVVYLADATPVEEAEREERRRGHTRTPQPDFDYTDYLRLHREEILVLAIPYAARTTFGTEAQQKRMEEESEMRAGKRTYKVLGHFPPTEDDPVLRLVFPRRVDPADKSLIFRLYLPGMTFPEREVEFRLKDLEYRGKLEL